MITIIMLVMLVGLFASGGGNFLLAHKVGVLENSPVVDIQYREIEVIKKAMCECEHPSSMHLDYNPDNTNAGGCQQEFFELQGKKTKDSFKCFCVKYVGPEPFTDSFDDRMRELQTLRPKEIG